MRKTKFTFFLILVVLTAVLTFIIVGENENYDDPAELSRNVGNLTEPSSADQIDLVANYQNIFSDILYEYQQQIVRQSMTRTAAVSAMREELLAVSKIPTEFQSLHLQTIIALSKDINGFQTEAAKLYQIIQLEYNWLFSRFNFLLN